jgi:hypothetical protein
MANNYQQFSEIVAHLTPAECEWFETELLKEDECEEGPACAWSINNDTESKTHLWVHADECGDIERVCNTVQAFIKKFRPDHVFTLQWADYCSKPRVGEFGGGYAIVTIDDVVIESTWWLLQQKLIAKGLRGETS